jgi:hypothetical protein
MGCSGSGRRSRDAENPPRRITRVHRFGGRWGSGALVAMAAVAAGSCSGAGGTATNVRVTTVAPRPTAPGTAGKIVGAWPTSIGSVGYRRGRVVVVRGGGLVWQSQLRFDRPPDYIDGVAVHGRELAFSVWGHGLYLARLPAAEVKIGRDFRETPLAWTRAGVLVTARRRDLIMRSATGAMLRDVPVRGSLYDPRSATYLMETRSGWLERTDGVQTWRLARLGRRLAAAAIDNLPGGRIALLGRGSALFLSATGQPLASAHFRRGRIIIATAAEAPGGHAYAFVVTHQPHPHHGGTDDIEVVGRGQHAAQTVAAVHVTLRGCAFGAFLFHWRGHWLHYRNGDHRLLAIDTSGSRIPIDLQTGR